MPNPTMFYRQAGPDADLSNVHENEHGKWEWIIVDLDEEEAPSGWQTAPVKTTETEKPKRRKAALEDGNGDGN